MHNMKTTHKLFPTTILNDSQHLIAVFVCHASFPALHLVYITLWNILSGYTKLRK